MNAPAAKPSCATCGDALVMGGGGSWCPRCALAVVLEEPDGAPEKKAGALFQVPGHTVLAELGRGAAGIVYRARQENPARDVALKILRPHEAGSVESRARFRLEATALAELDHPVILPVFSVGEHDGLPYFTMKLCVGGPLAHRLERYRGEWRTVAELVATLADGVHYAHSRGVLHRDLKPGNVLFDEADRPFVSDFGLAKLINSPEGGGLVTRPLVVMGTPGYVGPEVLAGGAHAATTAADVYALCAILHELLTGAPPVAAGVVQAFPAAVPEDLAVICGQGLRAEPTARYASADGLAADLRAWLAGRPIAARPRSGLGHLWAWARRNPVLAGVSLVAVILLATVALVATGAAVRLRQEQRATAAALARAQTETAISQAVTDFLRNDLLAQASPEHQSDRNLTLRSVLDRAAKKIEGKFADQPLVEAAIRDTLADTYRSLGEFGLMQQNAERSIEIYRQLLGEEALQTLAGRQRQANALFQQGKIPEAEPLSRAVVAALLRVSGPDHPDTLRAMETLGDVLIWSHKFTEAERVCAETVERERRVFGPEHPRTLGTLVNLAEVYSNEHRYAEAEKLMLKAWETRRRVLGPDHPETLDSMSHLVVLYSRSGNFPAARQIGEQSVESRIRTLGPDHPETLSERQNLANNYLNQGLLVQAVAEERAILPVSRRVQGSNHPATIVMMEVLGQALAGQGNYAEGESLLQEALENSRQRFGPEDHLTVAAMHKLAFLYQQEGKLGAAENLLRRALEICQRVRGPDDPVTLLCGDHLGMVLVKAGRPAEAESLLRQTLERRRQLFPEEWRTARSGSLLGEALAGEKRFAEAETLLLAGYNRLKDQRTMIPASADVSFRQPGECLVKLYTDWGKPEEAESWRRELAGAEKQGNSAPK